MKIIAEVILPESNVLAVINSDNVCYVYEVKVDGKTSHLCRMVDGTILSLTAEGHLAVIKGIEG
jgi:hypothetical protein